jgi:hypothetical protein
MELIPLPSHVHYELLLQLLERKTLSKAMQEPWLKEQVQQLIVTLRKAAAQQKQLETACEQARIPFEYYWSLNTFKVKLEDVDRLLTIPVEKSPLSEPQIVGAAIAEAIVKPNEQSLT